MKLRLRKASNIVKNAAVLLKKLESDLNPNPTQLNVDWKDNMEVWQKSLETKKSKIDSFLALKKATWTLREIINEENQKTGILSHLNKVKILKEEIGLFESLLENLKSNGLTKVDIERKIEDRKKSLEREKSFATSDISIDWFSPELKLAYEQELKTAKDNLNKAEDDIAVLNSKSEVKISQDLFDLLKSHSLV